MAPDRTITHEIRSGGAIARIAQRGAELRGWSVAGSDILWSPDARVWDAVAPVLFPIVGWLRDGVAIIDGTQHRLGVHGFASKRKFAIAEKSENRLRLVDRADAETRNLYPFAYRLSIDFQLGSSSLVCTAIVTNEGDRPMPYAFGLHPGFRWPRDVSAHLIFDAPENASVPVITADGLFGRDRRFVPLEDGQMSLTRRQMAREALCFLDVRSAGLTYEAQTFGRLRIEHDNFPHVAFWSRPPAPFLCVESWTGHGDPEGFRGELRDKPSMRLLAPGESARHAASYDFTPPF